MPDRRALFVTTSTSEPAENVKAWAHTMGPAARVTFNIDGPNNDPAILDAARDFGPDVIFYTGGVSGLGLPTENTFRALRKTAPLVMLQGDMADPPFHPLLRQYREHDCFDLFVGMDGVRDAPIDLATLTPLDPHRFSAKPRNRNIHCGFAGNVVSRARFELVRDLHKTEDLRSGVLHRLGELVRLRERELTGDYGNYIAFFRRCRMVINTSWAGSGTVHHVKGRVLEAAFSGCALLEMAASPLAEWFPPETFYTYRDLDEARRVITTTTFEDIARTASAFEAHARENYTADKIYRRILEAL